MKKHNLIRQNVLPVLAALIWGTAFVAQSVAAEHIPPFTFNAIRSAIAFVVLLPVCALFRRHERRTRGAVAPIPWKKLLLGALCCGCVLAGAGNFQQLGLAETSPGKAGFITALYVVLVPVFTALLGKKAPAQVWLGAVLAVAGLYLLCITESFSIQRSDLFVFFCAIVFAFHILSVDYFARYVDGIMLSCGQFLVMSLVSAVGALLTETPTWGGIVTCVPELLFMGVFSSGVAYTLQILAQKDSDPTVVTILLSLESVFSVIAGAVLLGDRLSTREYLGCVLMFAAVILAQVPLRRRNKTAQE